MTLNFPNESRSYDRRLRRIRFWAHDSALEIPFFVDASALHRLNPAATADDEAGSLNTFDLHREAIQRAAAKMYLQHRRGSYTLMASDFV